jgi:hypothetical protein
MQVTLGLIKEPSVQLMPLTAPVRCCFRARFDIVTCDFEGVVVFCNYTSVLS